MSLKVLLERHGKDRLSPASAGWSEIPLSSQGREDALAGARYIKDLIADDGWPKPTVIYSSTLRRSVETSLIAAKELGVGKIRSIPELRAYDSKKESVAAYERRAEAALTAILASSEPVLAVSHRSFQSFLAQCYFPEGSVDADPSFSHALTEEGGVLEIGDKTLKPMFRTVQEHWPLRAWS